MDDAPVHTVEVPFTYKATYQVKTWVRARDAVFAGTTTLSFATVDPEDAPVAFRLSTPPENRYHRNPFAPKEDGSPREVRWHADRFLVEADPVDEVLRRLAAGEENLKGTPFEELRARREEGVEVVDERKLRAKETKPLVIVDDGGRAMADELAKAAARCVVIGGVLFEEIPEPVVALPSYGDDAAVVVGPGEGQSPLSHTFGAHGGGNNIRLGDPLPAGACDKLHVEVLRPDLAMADRNEPYLMAKACKAFKAVADWQAGLPSTWAGPCARMARVLYEMPRHPTPALVDAFASVASLPEPGHRETEALAEYDAWREGAATTSQAHVDSRRQKLDTLRDLRETVVAALPAMRAYVEALPAKTDGLDPSVVTTKVTDRHLTRCSQARRREDVRRAARLMGVPMDDLARTVEDGSGTDLVLVEHGFSWDQAGIDLGLDAVALVDADGTVERMAVRPGATVDESLLSRHLARSAGPAPAPGGPRP